MKMSNAFREVLALAGTGQGALISLHTADPGVTGASEVTAPPYERQTTTWTGDAVDGVVSGSEVEFAVSAGTYSHISVRATDGTFLWSRPFPAPLTFPPEVGSPKIRITPTFTIPQGS